ncbi:hypothetical protein OK414_23520 [Priestia sp. JV24]|uniref:hypothetical protein n=1 Tax=Priestia TaxID=2800373 RepID=UPI0021D66E1C|nr:MULTISPECIES: hypothetical protein [Priestia]MCU7708394.1 hypothetical protein [Priestia megaterium]MCW1048020.1 hypothetical protein [Priestia sp. JV24]
MRLKYFVLAFFSSVFGILVYLLMSKNVPVPIIATIIGSTTASLITFISLRENLSYNSRKDLASAVPDKIGAVKTLKMKVENYKESTHPEKVKEDTMLFHKKFLYIVYDAPPGKNITSELEEMKKLLQAEMYKGPKDILEEIETEGIEIIKLAANVDAVTLILIEQFVELVRKEVKDLISELTNSMNDLLDEKKSKQTLSRKTVSEAEDIIFKFMDEKFLKFKDEGYKLIEQRGEEMASVLEKKKDEIIVDFKVYGETAKRLTGSIFDNVKYFKK